MNKILSLGLGLLLVPAVFGQTSVNESSDQVTVDRQIDPSTLVRPDTSEIRNKLTISGFVDMYYSYNTNNPGAAGNWGSTGVGRIFDGQHNQIAFNMIQTKFSYQHKGLEVVGDLLFGPGAELANFGNTGTSIAIKQAYVAYNFTDKLKLTGGQFGTHIGYELVDSPDNFNYSLSYLFGNGPFYHTGIKLDYAFNDKFAIMGGVLNGWDNLKDNNLAKSFAGQIAYTPNNRLELYLNWIGGNEDASAVTGDTINSYKQMIDLTASYLVSDKIKIGINGAYGMYNYDTLATKTWGGAALYLNYDFGKLFELGARVEWFDDVAGAQYLGASYMGYTLTGIFKLANDHFLIKPELRLDTSNEFIYFTNDPLVTSSGQLTAGISLIGSF